MAAALPPAIPDPVKAKAAPLNIDAGTPLQPLPPTSKSMVGFDQEIELADKTVRAKDNNDKLHAALQAKAKQAERMMVANQGLAFENRSLRNDVDLATESEVRGRSTGDISTEDRAWELRDRNRQMTDTR